MVKVGKRKVELSNLKKVLFPDEKILKAELIEYYLKISPSILGHVKGRALSFIRFPDGIKGEQFFQKNRPEGTPEWVDHVALGEDKPIDYILATEEASLVWLANMACIEFHQIHSHKPKFDRPDYMVFDLDPPEDYGFNRVVDLALSFKEHIEGFGYQPFVKTTGRKGLHILAPIEPKWDFDKVFEAASAIAKPFVEARSQSTTLHIKKTARKSRVLVDIYRNRPSQTIVSPYSVRGLPGAPVSTPLPWDRLESVRDPAAFNIRTVLEQVEKEGDAWEGMAAYATNLHTERKTTRKRKAAKSIETAGRLKKYAKKRSFKKTPEPGPEEIGGDGNSFVVHRHHASRLHYDLRLEKDGALRSWAVPKGMPPRPGIKRLAVSVEDHPMKYLTFEGTIPKGEYGGGKIWIFAKGKYEITKQKKDDSFYFRLHSRELNAEYRLIHTKNKEWLLERVDTPQVDWLFDPIDPMLAHSQKEPPDSGDYLYEVKWDGIRAMISLDDGEIRIRSRSQRDITMLFPELLQPEQAFRGTSALFDAEIVCLEEEGKPVFEHALGRLQPNSASGIARARAKHPAVCYLFDCLYLDGRPIVQEPLTRRKEWMEDATRRGSPYRISEVVSEGVSLFEAAGRMGLEGIMAKERESPYYPGKRSSQWLKIKYRQTAEYVVIGYTRGEGDREKMFGALHLGKINGEGLQYMGKVGTGFNQRQMKSIHSDLKKIKQIKRPVKRRPVDDSQTVWLEPRLCCEVQYASLTSEGTLREPVFIRLRPDLVPEY